MERLIALQRFKNKHKEIGVVNLGVVIVPHIFDHYIPLACVVSDLYAIEENDLLHVLRPILILLNL
jgi:hypothetical protein